MNIKTTKIAKGYYEFNYKGSKVEIVKNEFPTGETAWYWLINGEGGNDFFSTKKNAIISSVYFLTK